MEVERYRVHVDFGKVDPLLCCPMDIAPSRGLVCHVEVECLVREPRWLVLVGDLDRWILLMMIV